MLVVLVVLSTLNMGIMLMASAELTRLTASVAALRTADASLITLVTGLAAQIRNAVASGDSGALTALADSLDNETAAIVAAVKENTVSSDPDVPTDVPTDGSVPAFDPTAGDNTDIGTTSPAASPDSPVNEPGNVDPVPSDVETGQPQPVLSPSE